MVINVGDKSRGNSPSPIIGESDLLIDVNDSLQPWPDNVNIKVAAIFPENFSCIISGPNECGKTFLIKKYDDVVFIKEIKELPPPDNLSENLIILMIFDDVDPKKQIIKEYFCSGRHSNCNMIYLNQNLFSFDRQSVRENCNIFILNRQRGHVLQAKHRDFFNDDESNFKDLSKLCENVWKAPYNYLVLDQSKNNKININWDRIVFKSNNV